MGVFTRQLDFLSERVADGVKVLSLDYALRAAIGQHDYDTELSALRNHGNRIGATRMLLVGLDGSISADTAAPRQRAATPSRFPILLAGRRRERRRHRARDAERASLLDRRRAGARAGADRLHRGLHSGERCAAGKPARDFLGEALGGAGEPRPGRPLDRRRAKAPRTNGHSICRRRRVSRQSEAALRERERQRISHRDGAAEDRGGQRAGCRHHGLSAGRGARRLSLAVRSDGAGADASDCSQRLPARC